MQKSKPPLMIMHGLFGSKQNWRNIIALDARNHGESPHSNEHSSLHMSLDIIQLMKDMGIEKSSVLGHSMGGRTMMFLALKYPEYVQDGIIVDISPISIPRDVLQMEKLFLALKGLNVPSTLSRADGRKFAEVELKKVLEEKETVDFILLNLKKTEDGSFSWSFNADALYNNLKNFSNFSAKIAGLEPYKGRMSFICGKKSNFVDPNSWPEIQKLFPNSEIHWLDAGHLVHFEQPSKFIDLITEFLNK
ncbi:hypothetical protein DOY81_007597 [Sarcophaga bullata]|nr:hypothetical protein DOY81_007597 [Sarcophaga bullata]